MSDVAIHNWGNIGLIPVMNPAEAYESVIHGRLPASKTYPKGTILGEKIGINEFVTIIVDADDGTFTVSFGGETTAALDHDVSAAALQTALEGLDSIGAGNISVTNRATFALTHTAGTDGGTFALQITANGATRTTALVAWNVSAANLAIAINALSNVANATVTGSDGGPYTIKFSPMDGEIELLVVNDTTADGGIFEGGVVVTTPAEAGEDYVLEFINDLGNTNVGAVTTDATLLTGGAGTATVAVAQAGTAGTTGEFAEVDLTATDGTQLPKGLLMLDCATDASGNITYGGAATGDEHGGERLSAPIFTRGRFASEEVSGLTTEKLALFGRLVKGTIGNGVIEIGVN